MFYELLGQPKIEGVKVKLTYEDGSSEVVDAYEAQEHDASSDDDFGSRHWKGMCFDTRGNDPERPMLEPGKHEIALFCG